MKIGNSSKNLGRMQRSEALEMYIKVDTADVGA